MKILIAVLRLSCIILMVSCGLASHVMGQLTARNTDGYALTSYTNVHNTNDTIFVFNQVPQKKKGNLSLEYRPPSTIAWAWQKPGATSFSAYKTFTNATHCSIDTLRAGKYEIKITNSFVSNKTITCTVDTVKNNDGAYTVTVTVIPGGSKKEDIKPEPKGSFTVMIDPVECTFKWYRFNYKASTPNFDKVAFAEVTNAMSTSTDTLSQGGYKVSVTPTGEVAPRDSFVAWLYMNPGFNLKLYKDANGEVMYPYKYCTHTDFLTDPATPVVQSSFTYYNPVSLQRGMLDNKLSFTFKASSSGAETAIPFPAKQGSQQYFRDYNPLPEDTRYYFRGYDLFGVEQKDDILYETIIPKADMSAPILPEIEPTSAPVLVKFISKSLNAIEYLWRFGDGDSIAYDLEKLPPDTVKHTYYTPNPSGYTAMLFVTSMWGCRDSMSSPKIIVAKPALETANVFTPNGDGMNDHFKPYNLSIRQFEIWIYTRAGKLVYHFKGSDLRNWQGWDGRIQNSGKEAAEGVYFYVIKATGWDEPATKYDKNSTVGPFGGSFHLYR